MTNKTFLESKHWLSGETNDNATLMSMTPFYKVDFKDCLVKLGKFKLRQANLPKDKRHFQLQSSSHKMEKQNSLRQ